MSKTFLLALMTILFGLKIEASTHILTHEQFSHLSDAEKNNFIIKTMEFMVELESKSKKNDKTYVYNQKYSQILKEMQNLFFINSAHASETTKNSWDKNAKDFINLSSKYNPKKECISAGWITERLDNQSTCRIPDENKCDSQGKEKVSCNPIIFGYKTLVGKTLFCVDAGDEKQNSSFHCMEAALGLKTPPEGDLKSMRLTYIKHKLLEPSNKDLFSKLQQFIYKTCVCENSENRPHKSCYSMMNMIAETITCNERPSAPIDVKIFEKLKSHFEKKHISGTNLSEVDDHFELFIKGIRGGPSTEYSLICGETTPPLPVHQTKFSCTASCKKNTPDSETMTCSIIQSTTKNGSGSSKKPEVKTFPITQDKISIPMGDLLKLPVDCVVSHSLPEEVVPLQEPDTEPEKSSDEGPSIELSEIKGETSYKISAKLNNAEGWTFKWISKDTGDLKVEENWKNKGPSKTTSLEGISDDGSIEAKPKTVDHKLEIKQKRYDRTYQMCGQLTKTGEVTQEKCIRIEKLISKTNFNYNFKGIPIPPPPLRRSSDTSAMGIR